MDNILEKVKEVIRGAGKEVLNLYGDDNKIITKDDKTLVTEVDFLSEKIIINGLSDFGYGVLSEENLSTKNREDQKRAWVIDPIDGTLDFIKKTGEFSIMIGLVEGGQSILGAVYQPTEDKLYYATLGGGAFLEQRGETKRLKVSETDDFKNSSMLGSRHHMKELEVRLCRNLKILDFITHGSAGLKMCLVAERKADIYINSSSKTAEWDICAGDIIINEAGGKVTDMRGDKIDYNKEDYINREGFVVTNGLLHERVVNEIKKLR